MALNPNIVLSGKLPNMQAATSNLLQNVQGLQQIQEAPFRRDLLEQRGQLNEQALAQGEQTLAAGEQSLAQGERQASLAEQEQLIMGAQVAVNAFDRGDNDGVVRAILDSVPPEEQAQELAEFNANPSAYIGQAKDLISAFRSQKQGFKSAASQQFGAQETFKDSKGNFFFATQARDPSTGQVRTALSPIGDAPSSPVGDVKMVSGLGLTAQEQVTQRGAEASATTIAKENAAMRQQILKQGVAARGMIPNTKRLLELNSLINSGKLQAANKKFQDFFGVTNPNLGEFSARAGQLVLANIRQLGANPTEGERSFLTQITPSLEQGGEVNEALLKDMLDVQKRQVKRAKWFARNPGKTIEEYFLETDTDDFSASSEVTPAVEEGAAAVATGRGAAKSRAGQYKEGDTATHPTTGEKVVFRNGQWQSP